MAEPGTNWSASGPVEELAEAFLERCRRGEHPSISEYAERHPHLADEIRRVFPALLLMERAGDLGSTQGLPAQATAGQSPSPERIGRYEVLGHLREGGMGVIRLGRDPDLGRTVVLKTVRPALVASAQAHERFKREVRISGRLDHPGICPVLDIVSKDGRDYVVMPFIEGESLADAIVRARNLRKSGTDTGSRWLAVAHPLPESEEAVPSRDWGPSAGGSTATASQESRKPERAGGDLRGLLRLVENTAHAVHRAHEAGIVHRDLKPGNLLVRPNGEPVVLDFGLAFDAESGDQRLTEEGEVLGTPMYMAPEQVEGKVSLINRRTDVYALGVILYEVLTLECPYEGRTRTALFQRILKGDPVRPRKHNKSIPKDLEAVCLMAMALESERRYATALEFAEDLRRVRTLRPTKAKPPSMFGRILGRARRSPVVTAALVSIAVLGLATIALGLYNSEVRSTAAYQDAAVQALRSLSRGEAPRERDLTLLATLLPDEATRKVFLRNPNSPESWKHLDDSLADLTRGPGDDPASYRLLAPRAAVASLRPVFRFEVPDPGGEVWRYRLTLSSAGAVDRTYEVVQTDKGPLTFTLPEGELLEPGRDYTWTVGLDPERHREWVDEYQPSVARFQARDPAERDRLLKSAVSLESEAMSRLITAAALIAHGFAEDALQRLDSFPTDAGEEQSGLRAVLRAEALGLIEDDEGLRAALEDLERGPGGG